MNFFRKFKKKNFNARNSVCFLAACAVHAAERNGVVTREQTYAVLICELGPAGRRFGAWRTAHAS